jgi:Undecaprenyl-phosphate glucose phosphotransferase
LAVSKFEVASVDEVMAQQTMEAVSSAYDIRSSSVKTVLGLIVCLNCLVILLLAIFSDRYIAGYGHWFHLLSSSAPIVALVFTVCMFLSGALHPESFNSRSRLTVAAIISWVSVFCLGTWVLFAFKMGQQYSRIGVVGYFLMGVVCLTTLNMALTSYIRRRIAEGSLILERVAVVFKGRKLQFEQSLALLKRHGAINSMSVVLKNDKKVNETEAKRIAQVLRSGLVQHMYERVLVFVPWSEITPLQDALSIVPTKVTIVADQTASRVLRQKHSLYGSLTGFDIQRPPLSKTEVALKRAIDVFIALVACILLSPLMILTALAVWMESGKPVIFQQLRQGLGGSKFNIFKFRTMTVTENGADVVQVRSKDPRVTRLGSILRKTSIDELPQLLNVLRGDMSIVGPRPHALAHDQKYDIEIENYSFRQHVKPGITGWAQVNGFRGETREIAAMEARVDHDLWYIGNWSLALDLKIIFLTAIRVIRDKNAF